MDSHDQARAFAERAVAPTTASRDRDARWDPALFRELGGAGLLGAPLAREHGGAGLGALALQGLMRGFGEGAGDAGLALAWAAHTGGCALPIERAGSAAQRRRYLPPLASGEWTGALAHDERHTLADPLGVQTRAVRRGDRWVLRGRKTSVINGPVADVFLVTATTASGLSAFLLDRGAPGLAIGRPLDTHGMRTATIAEIVLDDCVIPECDILGPEGAGLAMYQHFQRWERACMLAPWCGLLAALLAESVAAAREQVRFGRSMACAQRVRAALADMKIRLELGRGLQARAAAHLDAGDASGARDIAVARLFLSGSIAQLTRAAAQIHGPRGAERGGLAERLLRDAAVAAHIGDGDEVLRSVIAGALLGLG